MQRLVATRVGVHTEVQGLGRNPSKICARCGLSRHYQPNRPPADLCRGCLLVEPDWGRVPFEQMPTSDSNVCAFDEPFISRENQRKREIRRRDREEK